MRGTALSEGIGEILTPLPPVPQCHVLIAKPAISVSTKFVYENLHANELRPQQHPDIDSIIDGIRAESITQICQHLGNVLETVTVREYPVIQEIKDYMMAHGADGALMSGSGPTVFGLFTDETAARKAYRGLRFGSRSQLAKQVYLTDFFNTTSEEK
jgi:4-diphosphocytidyl-2-C-methyl-D-erythritol kinase